MKRVFLLASLLLLAVISVALSLGVPCVQAQEATEIPTATPTPTVTPTPNYQVGIPLTSGNTLIIDRRISYGEIAIVIAVLALFMIFVIYLFIRVPRLWH